MRLENFSPFTVIKKEIKPVWYWNIGIRCLREDENIKILNQYGIEKLLWLFRDIKNILTHLWYWNEYTTVTGYIIVVRDINPIWYWKFGFGTRTVTH